MRYGLVDLQGEGSVDSAVTIRPICRICALWLSDHPVYPERMLASIWGRTRPSQAVASV